MQADDESYLCPMLDGWVGGTTRASVSQRGSAAEEGQGGNCRKENCRKVQQPERPRSATNRSATNSGNRGNVGGHFRGFSLRYGGVSSRLEVRWR